MMVKSFNNSWICHSYRAADKLIEKFQDTAFLEFAVGYHDGRETVILRDNNKEN